MRTTVTIDDAVYREVKVRAARQGRSVGSVIEDALRVALAAHREQATELPPLPVFGGGEIRPGIDLNDNSSLWAYIDEGVPLNALR